MNIFYEPHQELLKALIESNVDFMLIGGYAVNYYGFNRPTGDMDIWLRPLESNKVKLLNVLEQHKFNKESIDYVKSLDFTKPALFCMGNPPIRVDFLTQISGVTYEEAEESKIVAEIDEIKVPFIGLKDLILSKIGNNRTQDKLDIEELQKIKNKYTK